MCPDGLRNPAQNPVHDQLSVLMRELREITDALQRQVPQEPLEEPAPNEPD